MRLRDLLVKNPKEKSEVKIAEKNAKNTMNQEQQIEMSLPNVNYQEELLRTSLNATNIVYPFHDEKATSIPPPLSIDASISTDPQKPIIAITEEKIVSANLITEDLKKDDKKVRESIGTEEELKEKEETKGVGEKCFSMERTCDWRNCDMKNYSWQPCKFFGEKQKFENGVSLTKLAEIINISMKEAVDAIAKQCRMQLEEERLSSLEVEKRRNREDEICYDKNICKEKARVKNNHENRSHVIQEISNNRQINPRPREYVRKLNRREIQTYNEVQKYPKKNHVVENSKIDKKKENLRENSRDKKQQKLMNNVKTDNRRMTGNVNIYICSENVENAQANEKEKSKSCAKTISETTTEESSVPSSKLETNIKNKRKKSQDPPNFLNDITEIDSETSDVIVSTTNSNFPPPKSQYDFIENGIHDDIVTRKTESNFLENDLESIETPNLSDQTLDRRDLFVLSSETTYPLPNVVSNSMEIGEWSYRSTYSETNSTICLSDNDYSKYQRIWENDMEQISRNKNDDDRWLSNRVCVDRKTCLEAENDWQLKSICAKARYDSFDSIPNFSCTCICASDGREEDELSENSQTNSIYCYNEEKNFPCDFSDRKVFNNYRIKRKSLKTQRENAGKQWSVCSRIAEEEEGKDDCFSSEKDDKQAEELIIDEKGVRQDGKDVIELSKTEDEEKEKLEVHKTPIVEEEKKEEVVNELSKINRKRVSTKDEEKLQKESRTELLPMKDKGNNNDNNNQGIDNNGGKKIDTKNLEGEHKNRRESNESKRIKRYSRIIKDEASKQSIDLPESKIKSQLRSSIIKQRAQLKSTSKRISDKTVAPLPKKPRVSKSAIKNQEDISQKIGESEIPISRRRPDSKLGKTAEEKLVEESKDVSEEKIEEKKEDEKQGKGKSLKDKLKDSLLCKTFKKAMHMIKRRSARSKQHAKNDKIVEQTPRDTDVNRKYENNIPKITTNEIPAPVNGDMKGKTDDKDETVAIKKAISSTGKRNGRRDSLKRPLSTKDERIRKKDFPKTAKSSEKPEASAHVKDESSTKKDQIKLAYDKNRERILKSKLLTIIEKRRASGLTSEKFKEPVSTERGESDPEDEREPDLMEKSDPDSKETGKHDSLEKRKPVPMEEMESDPLKKRKSDPLEKRKSDPLEKRKSDSTERGETEATAEELTAKMEKSEIFSKRIEADETGKLKDALPEQTASKPRDSIVVKAPKAKDKTISREANGEKHSVCGAQKGETVCTQYVERESSETRFKESIVSQISNTDTHPNQQTSIKKFTQCGTKEYSEAAKEIQNCRCINSSSIHRCKKSSTYPRSCLKTNRSVCQTNIEKPTPSIHPASQSRKNCTCKKSQTPNYHEPTNDRSFTRTISKPRTNCTCNMYETENDRRRKKSMFCLYCDKPREKCICRAPIQKCTYCELSLDHCRCHDEEIFHDIRPVFIESDNDRSMHVSAWKPRKDVRRYFSRKPEDFPSKYKDDRRYDEKPKPHGSHDLPYQRLRVFSDVMSELQQKISETACCRRCKKIPCCCTVKVERERERDARRTRQFVSSKLWKDGSAEGSRGKSSRKYESKMLREGSERVVIMPICCSCRTMPCKCTYQENQTIVRPKCYYCKSTPCA